MPAVGSVGYSCVAFNLSMSFLWGQEGGGAHAQVDGLVLECFML